LSRAKDVFARGQQLEIDQRIGEAISELEKSRKLFERLGAAGESAIAESWVVQLLPDISKVTESRARLESIIALAETKKFKVLLPSAYYWLAICDYRQKDISRSQTNLKNGLRLAEAGNNTFEIRHALEALAWHFSKLGELESALTYASQMFAEKDLYYQSESQSLRDMGTMADLTVKLKFIATSFHLSRETLSMAQAKWPADKRVNSSLRRMVYAAIANNDFEAALKYANDSVQIALDQGVGADSTQTTAESYLLRAEVNGKQHCADAMADYDKALELYRRIPEFTVSLYQIHKGKLFCFQQLHQQENFDTELKTVLSLSEEYRNTIREDSSRQAFFDNEQVVYEAAIENAINAGDTRRAFEFVEASKARSLLEFVESGKSIAEVVKDYASVGRPLSLEEIQTRLPEQVQLIQYAVLADRLAIWIVSKKRFDFVQKNISATALKNKIGTYQAAIDARSSRAAINQIGEELYALLIPHDLVREKQLCVVADKSLHELAFATVISGEGKYLLEDYALFYAPSASVLVLATENARRKEPVTNESLLSVGNPDFDREENVNLPDLRDAEVEAREIAPAYHRSVSLVGVEATKKKFLQNFAGVEVIHFAGHFVANAQSPSNSKLLFAGGDLRSSELGAYRLPKSKLVVLSACETGFERYNKSEGAIGIARTWLALGSPLVIASQWKVDSEPTKDLMIAFHRNRKEKHFSSAESLRQAQLQMLRRNETSAPFYWGAFSLFGGYANY
jgi:CHAT domain-containing protein